MREVTIPAYVASTCRSILLRLAVAAGIVLVFVVMSRAGGPKCVAGTSYFDPTTTGQSLVWPQGVISYYTDQGDLSAILPKGAADNFVAGAFAVWTSVPTAALAATSEGSLAENVSGSNVSINADGTIAMPADIQPTATGTPIGVVYDADGSVIDAFVGAGAGDSDQCPFNGVIGGNDNYGPLATYQHGLIVINGQCAQQNSQLTDLEYRLVRVIGSVLGLGWSQMNANVQTGSPYPTSDDYAGFPVMHFTDPWNCVPITLCDPNPYQLSMDDAAAISRLYPVTAQNLSGFSGKQVFSSTTARIHGSVYFTDSHGNRTEPMQGVNVVARWIDPATGKPSRRYAASSVSGFPFRGNQGNPVTGFDDALGNPYSEWGSTDSSQQGFFDLSGLQPPSTGAQYQLSVEALNAEWSYGVGPYLPGPVSPSGIMTPITVTVTPGGDIQQDILMSSAAQPLPQTASSWESPVPLPSGGDWVGSLNKVGDIDYFEMRAQANRTLSVAVTALDESGRASVVKVQPVIGMWAASDLEGTVPPAYTSSPFNQVPFAMTRLDVSVIAPGSFLIGVADVRGDGRPDYRYQAHVLYADSVLPARVSVNGGPVALQGVGFAAGFAASVGSTAATALAISSGEMTVSAPPHADGAQDISVSDPLSGGSTTMTGAITYGAAATDNIILLGGGNPHTPVGTQAANPVNVRVVAADGVTPISGATVGWSSNNNVQFSACGGATACSVITDQGGNAASWITPGANGVATITATLAPGVYSPSKSVSTTLSATESSSDIGASTPYVYVSQGATVSIPLTARVLSSGVPRNNVQVNFAIVGGSATLSAASAQSNSNGYATVNLSVTQIAALVQVSACVAPNNVPCETFYVNAVPPAQQKLLQVSGAGQISTGLLFQPVTVRVTDSASPPNSVVAAPVNFLITVLRPEGNASSPGDGETDPGNPAQPVILKVTQSSVVSDANGLAALTASSGGFSAPVEVDVTASAGTGALIDDPLFLLPAPPDGTQSSSRSGPPAKHPIALPVGRGLER